MKILLCLKKGILAFLRKIEVVFSCTLASKILCKKPIKQKKRETHPFTRWRVRKVTVNERRRNLSLHLLRKNF